MKDFETGKRYSGFNEYREKDYHIFFKGLYNYPATLCTSIDDEVVHGLPSNRKLKEGEIFSVDVG